jgi:hypothetical protein
VECCYQRDTGSYLPATSFWRNADYYPWPYPHFARNRRLVGPRDISARCDSVVKRSRPMLSRLFSWNNINKLPSYSTMSWQERKATLYSGRLFWLCAIQPFLEQPTAYLFSAPLIQQWVQAIQDLYEWTCVHRKKNYYFRFHISHVHKLGQKHDTFYITLNQKTNQSLRRLQYIVMISSSVTCITTIWDVRQISSWFSFQATLQYWEQNAWQEITHNIVITLTWWSR